MKPMKSLLALLTASALTMISAHANTQSPPASRICGPYGCEQVPVSDLPKPSAASTSSSPYVQKHASSRKSVTRQATSTDLYCESMAMAFVESMLDYKPPSSPTHAKRVDATQAELLGTCKSMPTVGGVEKKQRDMNPQELSQISCLGVAEGIATAQASKTEDRHLYSKLTQNRQFFAKACTTNRKQFLSDMRKYGPYHVLSKTY